jgi:hypothetical protein
MRCWLATWTLSAFDVAHQRGILGGVLGGGGAGQPGGGDGCALVVFGLDGADDGLQCCGGLLVGLNGLDVDALGLG